MQFPDHHRAAVAAALRLLGVDVPFPVVMDVGCGTAAVCYVQAAAERLPVGTGSADLVATAAADAATLRFIGSEQLAHNVAMTADTLTDYLLSQSNATSAIDAGRTSMDDLRRWLRAEIAQRLPSGGNVQARFACAVWCCRKSH